MLFRKSLCFIFLLYLISTTFSCNEEKSPAPNSPLHRVEKFLIPDANFKLALVSLIPKAFEEGKLLVDHEDIAKLETLDVSSKSISSLDGIQFLVALKNLDCSSNSLTTLDVSKNTALTELRCYSNQLATLDVSKNRNLTTLNCTDNLLTSLDVSKNTALLNLYCNNNQLTALDLSSNTALTMLYTHNNQLRSLSVAAAVRLVGLYIQNNPPLSTLDLANNTALTMLNCSDNALTTLDLRGMRSKMYDGALDVTKNPKLTTLNVHVNLKDDPSIKALKTERGTALTISTYTTLDLAPTSYTLDCTNYNPTATTEDKCITK